MCSSAHVWPRIESGGSIHHRMIKSKSAKSKCLAKGLLWAIRAPDTWESVLSKDFFFFFAALHLVHMRKTGWGRILDIEICYLSHSLFLCLLIYTLESAYHT